MDIDEKKRELTWLKNQIRFSRGDKRKAKLVEDYLSLLYFLSDVSPNDINYNEWYNEIALYIEKRNKYVEKEKMLFISDCDKNIGSLIELNNKMLKIVLDNKIVDNYPPLDCNEDDCAKIFKNLINLDPSIKKAYTFVKDNIYFSDVISKGTFGYCTPSCYAIKPSIFIDVNLETFLFFNIVSHELGHAYEAIITDTVSSFTYKDRLKAEISSKFFERLYSSLIPNESRLSKVRDDRDIEYRGTIQMQVLCQDIISLMSKDKDINCDDDGNVIVDINDYLTDYNKGLLKHPEMIKPSFYNYAYIIGDIVTNNLFKYYGDNYKALLKELKNLLMNLPRMNTRDLINDYCDINATKEETEKVYKYQKKIFHI